MAALEPAAPRTAGSSKPRARKHSFRPDMTPMVDLAFLLLTFFMLTTTFARPRVMQLTMPARDGDQQTPVRQSQALTVLLGPARQVYYYFGLNDPTDPAVPRPTLHRTDFGPRGIRQVLLGWQRRTRNPVVLIAPGPDSKYRAMVDMLDELNITNQRRYALVALRPADRQLLATAR